MVHRSKRRRYLFSLRGAVHLLHQQNQLHHSFLTELLEFLPQWHQELQPSQLLPYQLYGLRRSASLRVGPSGYIHIPNHFPEMAKYPQEQSYPDEEFSLRIVCFYHRLSLHGFCFDPRFYGIQENRRLSDLQGLSTEKDEKTSVLLYQFGIESRGPNLLAAVDIVHHHAEAETVRGQLQKELRPLQLLFQSPKKDATAPHFFDVVGDEFDVSPIRAAIRSVQDHPFL